MATRGILWTEEDFRSFMVMIERLTGIRIIIEGGQNAKLLARWKKYGDYRDFSFEDITRNLKREWKELKEALSSKGPDDIKDEIYDIRNMLEFLFDFINHGITREGRINV